MIWIWTSKQCDYAEFRLPFEGGGEDAVLRIAADFRYAAFLNGQFLSCGQYPGGADVKYTDEVPLKGLMREGRNELTVLACHPDGDYAASYRTEEGVAFEIVSAGKVLAHSCEDTLCRPAPRYAAGDLVTPQLGRGVRYDFTAEGEEFLPARLAPSYREEPRPVKRCEVMAPAPAEVCAQGIYRLRGGETAGERAQLAFLASMRFSKMTGKDRLRFSGLSEPLRFAAEGGDGVYVLVDLKEERAGYLSLAVSVKEDADAILAWGEHLADLRVRAAVGGRNFAYALRLRAGENVLDEYLHRIGCRYLCLFVSGGEMTLSRLTLRPEEYPFKHIPRVFSDGLCKKLYEVGERTLRLCAHEHYEDCPWREQALYGMDSRSQMLYGYTLFEEYELPRASIAMLADSVREDGLIDLCAPARAAITIPSFSVYFVLALIENAAADFDGEFVKRVLPKAERVLGVFASRADEKGIPAFTEIRYWNFHEWSEGLDGGEIFRSAPIEPYYDGVLTALVLQAASGLSRLETRVGNNARAIEYLALADKLAAALPAYRDGETGLYFSFLKKGRGEGLHSFAQACYLLTGRIPKAERSVLAEELKRPVHTVPLTLGSLHFKYDAILLADGDADYCISDVTDRCAKMLFRGATSFWETEAGEADFEDAGSLCHGWAAVCCYIYDRLGVAKRL